MELWIIKNLDIFVVDWLLRGPGLVQLVQIITPPQHRVVIFRAVRAEVQCLKSCVPANVVRHVCVGDNYFVRNSTEIRVPCDYQTGFSGYFEMGVSWVYPLLAILTVYLGTVHSLHCYQCNSTNSSVPFQCNEVLSSDIDIEPQSCDAVFGAQYCVKHTGRFEVNKATGLDCYQCAPETEMVCGNSEWVVNSLQPRNCSHIYEARYCIKSVGRYGGGIGTKRFCSAQHLGNYCDYVKHSGDKLTYRSCIYTCTGDGCNPATTTNPSATSWIMPVGILLVFRVLFQR